jgi:Bifunctional DNA primase/polymerase, N-terminal
VVVSLSHRLSGEKNPLLAAALELAKFGFYIYPSPKKNGPARIKWRLGSTRDAALITKWWTQWPRDLICLDCGKSKIAVIDADSVEGHGIDGLTSLLDLELRHGLLPETLKARTPSGGEHYFFSDSKGKMKSTAGVLAPGVDTKGVGGMVVLAPSLVKGKGAYRWINDLPIAELPQWVIDNAGTPAEQGPVPDAEFEPAYTQDQFEERLRLIDVDQFSGKHDEWLAFMLACTHSSTVDDGKAAFIDWTTGNGEGEYASDVDPIETRWDYNYQNNRNKGGKAYKVGTFNKYLTDAGHADLVLYVSETSAAEDFAEDEVDRDSIEVQGDPAKIAVQAAERARAKADEANGIRRRKPRRMDKKRIMAIKRAAAMVTPYRSKSNG